MKGLLFGGLLFFLGCAAVPEKKTLSQRKIFLYEISAAGRSMKSYILGTVHFGVRMSEVSLKIPQLLKNTKTHFYEQLFPRNQARYFLRVQKDPLNLYRSMLFSSAKARGLPPLPSAAVTRVKALGVPAPIAEAMADKDCDLIYHRKYLFAGKSLDFEIMHRSYRLGKEIQQLDSRELRQQAQRANENSGMDFSCSVEKDILQNPKEPTSTDQVLDPLFASYTRGDAAAFTDSGPGVGLRNKVWMQQLQPSLSQSSVFIVVGNNHLHGAQGLLKMMAKKGFRVRRMKP